MIRPRRVLALILALAALVALAAFVAPATPQGAATAAKRAPLFSHPVHRGSSGRQVLAAKWILSGHNQGLRKPVIRTYRVRGKPSPDCGKPCVRAILAARWLLGEPLKYDKSCRCHPAKRARFTRDLYLLLTTKKARPLGWIGRAGERLAAAKKLAAKRQTKRQANACAKLLIAHAARYLGVHEDPWGSNTGQEVRLFQAATTYGRGNFPWCMAYVNFIAREVGIRPDGRLGPPFHRTSANYRTPGPIANGTAGVYVAFDAGRRHGWLRASPVVGAIVLYMTNGGHTGYVTGVSHTGFSTIEGNSGDRVAAHSFPFGYRRPVFLVLPCVQGARA